MKLPKITNTTIITKCDQKVITKCDIYYNMMQLLWSATTHPAGCYIFKTSNRNTRTSCEICLKLTIKTPELRQWHHSGRHHNDVIGVVLVSLLLTLNIFHSLFTLVTLSKCYVTLRVGASQGNSARWLVWCPWVFC